jgi:hypothetical protein
VWAGAASVSVNLKQSLIDAEPGAALVLGKLSAPFGPSHAEGPDRPVPDIGVLVGPVDPARIAKQAILDRLAVRQFGSDL